MKKNILLIEEFLQQKKIMQSNTNLVCAVSGGQDSTFLLLSFFFFKKQENCFIESVYCQHFLQVKNFFCFWQLIRLNFILRIPISIVVANFSVSKENMARWWRKESFERILQFSRNAKLLFGHTASDQLETCFQNLMRSSGSEGVLSLTSSTSSENFSILGFFSTTLATKETKKVPYFHVQKKQPRVQFLKTCKKMPSWNSSHFIEKKKQKLGQSVLVSFIKTTDSLLSNQFKYSATNLQLENKMYNSYRSYVEIEKTIKKQFLFLFYSRYSYYSSDVRFSSSTLRPMLVVHRNDVSILCHFFEFPIVNDLTNKFLIILRNKIRQETFPLIRYFYSKNTDFLFLRFLNILEQEQKYLYTINENFTKNFLKKLKIRVFFSFSDSPSYFSTSRKKEVVLRPYNKQMNKFNDQSIYLCKKSQMKIRVFVKKLTPPLQRIYIKKIFFCYTNTHLSYLQIENLRILI